jgi:hypothetical protein
MMSRAGFCNRMGGWGFRMLQSPPSNHQQMTGAVGRATPTLVVNLRGRNVPVSEQFLHLSYVGTAV